MDRAHVTALLVDLSSGDRQNAGALFPIVYDELRRVARHQLRREHARRTLNTTGLVHEAYLRLVDQTQLTWKDRAHFFAIAARSMRQILVDAARRRRRLLKRGGDRQAVSLAEEMLAGQPSFDLVLSVDTALNRLAERDERLVQIVECRFFSGMTVQETAEALGLSTRTVERGWRRAKAYLAYLFTAPDDEE